MELRVDPDLCEANGVCVRPRAGRVRARRRRAAGHPQPDPPDDRLEQVRKAVERCPKNALELRP